MVGRSIGDVLGAAEIVEDVAHRVCGRERRAEPRDQVVVIPSAAGYPPQLVDMAIGAEIDDMLCVLGVEHVASGIADGRNRRASDGREVAAVMPVPSAVSPKLTNRSRA